MKNSNGFVFEMNAGNRVYLRYRIGSQWYESIIKSTCHKDALEKIERSFEIVSSVNHFVSFVIRIVSRFLICYTKERKKERKEMKKKRRKKTRENYSQTLSSKRRHFCDRIIIHDRYF